MTEKLNFAFYWAASCGGCDVAVLDINEKILDVANIANIVLWPVAVDTKYEQVKSMPDGHIDVCFFNGAIRNSEQKELAELLREKSKTVVALGSCSCFGGIPALANLYSREEILNRAYKESQSTANENGTLPQTKVQVPQGELTLPEFFHGVYALGDLIEVDYFLPGCPPTPKLILDAVAAIAGGTLPPRGSVLAPDKTVCDECERVKETKKVTGFVRPHLVAADPKKCLLECGIICCGPATRAGCGAQCIKANMPCRGCMGPTKEVVDHGAKIASAVATTGNSKDEAEIERGGSQIVDPVGTFYRFGLSSSLLKGRVL